MIQKDRHLFAVKVRITTEGEKLLRYCHTITDFSHETLMEIMHAGMKSLQRVTVSGPSSMMISRVIPCGMRIMRQFPQLYINFDINDNDDIATALRMGTTQFSILKPEKVTRDMQFKILAPEKYSLVCTKKWKSRKLKEILQAEPIIDFDEADQMTINYLKHFGLLKYAQSDRIFVNRTESLSKMLIEGFGYGVLTQEFSKDLISNGLLIKLNAGRMFDNFLQLAWYKRPEPPKYFLSIINNID